MINFSTTALITIHQMSTINTNWVIHFSVVYQMHSVIHPSKKRAWLTKIPKRCTENCPRKLESTPLRRLVILMWYFIILSLVKPDNVTLERNTTENNGCTDMWVNFTCNSSEANPPVHNYVLLRNETDVGVSEKGTWIKKISRGETFVFKCQAYQQVDNVTSTNNISLSVKGKISLFKICRLVWYSKPFCYLHI